MNSVAVGPELRRNFRFFTFSKFRLLLLLLAGVVTVGFLMEAVRFLPVRSDNMYPEAGGVLMALRWSQGLPLYTDFRRPPYLLAAFPPLWFSMLAAAGKAGVSDINSLTFLGRIVNLLFLLGAAWLTYLWNRLRQSPRALALLAPLLLLCFPDLIPWGVTARPDALALFLAFAAVVLVGFRAEIPWLLAASLVASLAFLSKQSLVAAPTAIVLWLLCRRRWKHALLFCSLWGFVVSLTLGLTDRASAGLLRLNLSPAHFGKFSLRHVHGTFVALVERGDNGLLLLLFAFGILGIVYSFKDQNSSLQLLRMYFAAVLAFTILGSGVAGANVNHYIELALVLATFAPVGLEWLMKSWPDRSPVTALLFVLVVVIAFPTIDLQRWRIFGEQPADFRHLASLVQGRRVLTEIPYVAARSSDPEFNDPISFTYAEQAGQWSPQSLAQSLVAKDYELVILYWPIDDPRRDDTRYPKLGHTLRKAITDNYSFCFELDSAYVYGRIPNAGLPASIVCQRASSSQPYSPSQ